MLCSMQSLLTDAVAADTESMDLDTPFRQQPEEANVEGSGSGNAQMEGVSRLFSPGLNNDPPHEEDDDRLPPGSPLSSISSQKVGSS